MCAVSVIFDYGRQQRIDWWNRQNFEEFQKLVKDAEEFDEKTDQPDCEDPKKAEWMEEVEERLRALESEAWRRQNQSAQK